MSAAGDREPRELALSDAWQELEALAVAMRQDWKPDDVRDARIAAQAAWPYERAARELWRLIWDPYGEPADLRNAVRAERPQPPHGPEVNARGRALAAALYEARHPPQEAPEGGQCATPGPDQQAS